MRTFLKAAGIAVLLSGAMGSRAEAQTNQTFDFELGLTSPNEYPALGNFAPYFFSGLFGLNATMFTQTYGGGYTASSGSGVVWGHGSASIGSSTPFVLKNLKYGAGWYNNYAITMTGSLNGVDVWTRALNGSLFGPTALQLSADGSQLVDKVTFQTSGYEFYLDDVSVGDPAMALVQNPVVTPEPVTMTLLATGLFGIGGAGFARRRRGEKKK